MEIREIKKVICIGANCIAADITHFAGLRIPGPVDNFSSFNIWKSYLLFSGKIKKSLFYEDYEVRPSTEQEIIKHYYWDKVFSFNHGFYIVHNNFENPEYQKALKNRIKFFKYYSDLAKKDDSLWFIYSLDKEDEKIDEKFMNQIIKSLPDYCQKRLLCIGMRAKNLLFKKYFKYYCEFNEDDYKWHDKEQAEKILNKYEKEFAIRFLLSEKQK